MIIAVRVLTRTTRTNELIFEPFHVRDELINGMVPEKYSFIYMEKLIYYQYELTFYKQLFKNADD